MPDKYKDTFAGGRWFEEDCDYAKVVVSFPKCFEPDQVEQAQTFLKSYLKYKS